MVRAMVAVIGLVVAMPSASVEATAGAPQLRPVCAAGGPGFARCFAVVSAVPSHVARGAPPAGYMAADLESAYKLPIARGAGQVIAIVDAFDDPTAGSDLAVYRSKNGLPPCGAGNGCFRKLNDSGKPGPYPPADPGWGIEISLDLDMVSAACPLCHIVLVEASSPEVHALGKAVNTAASLGVAAISNSYGLQEFNGMQSLAADYHHAGTTILVASGDFGFGPANFPAVLASVVAVGGTSLTRSANRRGWAETAWFGSASGCSAYVSKPSWQRDKHCSMRTVADVAADADSSPGLAVYDTSIPPGFAGLNPGWIAVGGTSASSPFVAGVVGLAGNGHSLTPGLLYKDRKHFFDTVGGSNGYCGGDYLCNALAGYDGPTGLGTPDGSRGL